MLQVDSVHYCWVFSVTLFAGYIITPVGSDYFITYLLKNTDIFKNKSNMSELLINSFSYIVQIHWFVQKLIISESFIHSTENLIKYTDLFRN